MSFFEDLNTYIEFLTIYICLSGIILIILLTSAWKAMYNQNIIYKEVQEIRKLIESQIKEGEMDNGSNVECTNKGTNSSC